MPLVTDLDIPGTKLRDEIGLELEIKYERIWRGFDGGISDYVLEQTLPAHSAFSDTHYAMRQLNENARLSYEKNYLWGLVNQKVSKWHLEDLAPEENTQQLIDAFSKYGVTTTSEYLSLRPTKDYLPPEHRDLVSKNCHKIEHVKALKDGGWVEYAGMLECYPIVGTVEGNDVAMESMLCDNGFFTGYKSDEINLSYGMMIVGDGHVSPVDSNAIIKHFVGLNNCSYGPPLLRFRADALKFGVGFQVKPR